MSGKPGGYVGQDFGELSRAAVLESGHAELWSIGVLRQFGIAPRMQDRALMFFV
jgi:hypothetical protein